LARKELIAKMQRAHVADFAGFHIEFDNYGSTHCPENRALCEEIWAAIRKAGMVHEQEVEQLYDTGARLVPGRPPGARHLPASAGRPSSRATTARRAGRTTAPPNWSIR
jgi:hypothetical protein